jgi:peptidoglycan/xylan/chitin deacetylase (PgdA/CDA1 family)
MIRVRNAIKQAMYSAGFHRRRLSALPYPGTAVLAYHGIRPAAARSGAMPYEGLHVRAHRFDEQCAIVRELCQPLSFEAWTRIADGETAAPARAALITFDDGYKSVLTEALPILEKYEIPAVVFLCTQPIEQGHAFWFDAMAAKAGEEAVEQVKALPWSEWRTATAPFQDAAPAEGMAPLTVEDVRELAAHPLITIGSHSATHPLLSRAPVQVQHEELARSKATIESWIGRPVTAFAYPNGRPRIDYTEDTIRELEVCGYRHAFAVGFQFARGAGARFEQRRFLMLDAMVGVDLAHRLTVSWPRGAEAIA